MEVKTLGKLGAAACESCEGPPSSTAIISLYRREPGAWMRVVGSTLLRAVLVSPGVGAAAYLAGARRPGRLAGATVAGALLASVGITAFLAVWYAVKGVPTAPGATAAAGAGASPSQLASDAAAAGFDAAAAAARAASGAPQPVMAATSGVGAAPYGAANAWGTGWGPERTRFN